MGGVSVITGGAGGMGLATARLLGREHTVVLCGQRIDRLALAAASLRSEGIEAVTRSVDVADRAGVDRVIDEAAAMGDLRSIVHAAGIGPSMGGPERVIAVNAIGTIHVTDAALRVASPGFALVNVASNGGYLLPPSMQLRPLLRPVAGDPVRFARRLLLVSRMAPRGWRSETAYAYSKSFVIWWTQQRAAAFGEKGARALSVSPGSFDTELGRRELRNGADLMAELGGIKRFGEPEEIASLIAFCAGDSAGYLTGCDVLCDGGTTAGRRLRDQISILLVGIRNRAAESRSLRNSGVPSSEA